MSIQVTSHRKVVVQPVYETTHTIEGLDEDDLLHLAAILYRYEPGPDHLRIWSSLPEWVQSQVIHASDTERERWRSNGAR